MKYKAILLVIASSDSANDFYWAKKIKEEWRPVFPFFKQIYMSYITEHDDFKIFFVYGNSAQKETEHDLVYDIEENDYPGIVTKTLMAMEFVDKNYDYDFIIRTNLSTFWDLAKLSKRLDTLPKENCVAGTPVKFSDPEGNSYSYIAGHDMVISRDLVKYLVSKKDKTITQKVYANLEDLSMFTTISELNPALFTDFHNSCVGGLKLSNFDLTMSIYESRNADHLRVRNINNRSEDKEIMKKLLLITYDKTIL